MPNTLINCPNCRQPITADIDQLFDVGVDPSAKQRLLSGAFNLVQCPRCGYRGNVSTLLVYHDPDKELLISFVPPEIGLSRTDQEKQIGALINRVLSNLAQEKRKAYLLNPQTALTLQGMIERVLEADGITREMIQAQQKKLALIQRMLGVHDDDVLSEIARQEDAIIDMEFFSILRRLIEAAAMSGDQAAAGELNALQNNLLPITSFGRELQGQTQEVEAAIKALQSLGKELTRDKLLDLVVKSPSETYLSTIVSLTRPAMDYQFFQLLSDRIDRARGDGRARLVALREQVLELTRAIDQEVERRRQSARQLLDAILESENIEEAMMQNLPAVDEFFLQELNTRLEQARKLGDLSLSSKYSQMLQVIQQVSQSQAGVGLVEELLDVPEGPGQEEAWQALFDSHQDEITQEFLDMLAGITNQVQSGDDHVLAERLKALNRSVLRFTMQRNLRG